MAIDGCAPRAKMNQQRPGLNGSWWWWSHPLLNFSIWRVQDLTSDQRHAKASWMLRLSEISSCQWCARSTRACTADGGGQLWGPTGVGNIMIRKDLKYFSEMISINLRIRGFLLRVFVSIYGYSISRSTGHVWSSLWLQLYYSRRVGSESNTSWLDRLVESENDLFGEWSFEDPKSKRIESLDLAFKTCCLETKPHVSHGPPFWPAGPYVQIEAQRLWQSLRSICTFTFAKRSRTPVDYELLESHSKEKIKSETNMKQHITREAFFFKIEINQIETYPTKLSIDLCPYPVFLVDVSVPGGSSLAMLQGGPLWSRDSRWRWA